MVVAAEGAGPMRLSVNGTKLFVDVEGAKFVPEGDIMREKPTIVLLHGGPGFDHSQFKPQFSQLADVAQLVYLDHRGCGRSDRDDPDSWTLETWADDVKGVCDALEIERPIVLGWSFGGFVAMAYAARYPGHAQKLILQSTAARLDVDAIAAAFEAVGGAEPAAVARAFWTAPDNETMAAYLQHCIPLYHPGPLDPGVLTRCLLNVDLLMGFDGEKEMDQRAALRRIDIPVLVVAGRLDPITPVAAAEEIVAGLGRPDVRLEVFGASGHFVHLSEPDPFFTLVRSFVMA
jgi:pimeloyl-ACP methyl ester carboxylesterase